MKKVVNFPDSLLLLALFVSASVPHCMIEHVFDLFSLMQSLMILVSLTGGQSVKQFSILVTGRRIRKLSNCIICSANFIIVRVDLFFNYPAWLDPSLFFC